MSLELVWRRTTQRNVIRLDLSLLTLATLNRGLWMGRETNSSHAMEWADGLTLITSVTVSVFLCVCVCVTCISPYTLSLYHGRLDIITRWGCSEPGRYNSSAFVMALGSQIVCKSNYDKYRHAYLKMASIRSLTSAAFFLASFRNALPLIWRLSKQSASMILYGP